MSIIWPAWPVLVGVLVLAFGADQWLHRGQHESPGLRRAVIETVAWTALGIGFFGVAWALRGGDGAVHYLTAYTLEKSLSLDNVAVFAVVVAGLGIPASRQRRLIDHAIVAALVLRLGFIAGGLALLDHVHAVLYGFGAILLVSGVRLFRAKHQGGDEEPRIVQLARRVVPIAEGDVGDRYLSPRSPAVRRRATPQLVALLALAVVDVVFAVDSVPAVFAITSDAWVVCAANAFALLGLRPMYFLLAEGMQKLRHLQRGLAVILTGIGVVMIVEQQVHIPSLATLGFVLTVLTVSIAWSLRSSAGNDSVDPDAESGQAAAPSSPEPPQLAISASNAR